MLAVETKPVDPLPCLEPGKAARSAVLVDYALAAGYCRLLVISCGNAAAALREEIDRRPRSAADRLTLIALAPNGPLLPARWLAPAEVPRLFGPDVFDATPGHLPLHLMNAIAARLGAQLGPLAEPAYVVPCGSGETVLCLRLAFPGVRFVPVYNCGPGTEYHPEAPLNGWVALLCAAPRQGSGAA